MSSSPSIKSSMNSAASRRTFFRWRELGRAPQCVKLPQRRTAHLAQRAARLAAPPPRTHRVTTTTDVRFWGVRRKRSRNVLAYEVRWVVAGKQRSRSRRTRELGIRMALGATRPLIVQSVFAVGFRPIAFGLAAGVALALAVGESLARFMRLTPVPIDSRDPLAFAIVIVLLGSISILAMLKPSLRAAALDPARALRND